ncbi:hypothetical protein BDD30_4337 [Photorhabdus asymbiotica]|uniref:Secreted protein n=1 Tax=Photorhabdus asymbiotica TaxID=291112 RepID=A0ABX9SL93_9GAMM|nr:hypothetical protein BDD30_4337 [Photorhabdus asymbiotica]
MKKYIHGIVLCFIRLDIPFILQVADLLATFTHPSHRVIYAPGDSFTGRRAVTRNLLGIYGACLWVFNKNFDHSTSFSFLIKIKFGIKI